MPNAYAIHCDEFQRLFLLNTRCVLHVIPAVEQRNRQTVLRNALYREARIPPRGIQPFCMRRGYKLLVERNIVFAIHDEPWLKWPEITFRRYHANVFLLHLKIRGGQHGTSDCRLCIFITGTFQ